MHPDEDVTSTLEQYRNYELQLHHELMNCCRKYVGRVSIISILGILDIVKEEAFELEQATRGNVQNEKS